MGTQKRLEIEIERERERERDGPNNDQKMTGELKDFKLGAFYLPIFHNTYVLKL